MCTFHFAFRYSILLTLMIMMGNKKLGKYPTGIKRAKDGQDEIKTVHSYHILLIISSMSFIAILLLSFHPASLFCLSIYILNCAFPITVIHKYLFGKYYINVKIYCTKIVGKKGWTVTWHAKK